MRRITLALALPLLLLFAQQGALLHELSHTYYTGRQLGAQVRQDELLPDNSVCPACQAFAQVTTPVGNSAAIIAVPPAAYLPSPSPAYHIIGAAAPTPRSRGPPPARV
jgi:hypothetical protein